MPRRAQVNVEKFGESWRVDTSAIKPRYRKCWPTEVEARRDAERIKRQISGTGMDASDLRSIDAAMHRIATTDFPGRGKDLSFIAEWFIANYSGDSGTKTLAAWATEFKDLKKVVVQAKTLREIEQYVDPAVALFGHLIPDQVSDSQLSKHIAASTSQWHRSKVLRGFFGWLAGRKTKRMAALRHPPIKRSPFDFIAAIPYERMSGEVVRLDIGEVRKAIEIAIKDHPEALPWFIFLVFTGVRPDAEAPGFWTLPGHGWNKIDLARRLLTITKALEKTKKRNRQLVLPPNVVAWLDYFKAKGTTMTCPRRAWRKFKEAAYPKPEPDGVRFDHVQDLLRHTAISNYAKRLSVVELEFQFATSQDMIMEHYLSQIADESEVDEFFSLTPQSFGLV